MLQKQMLSFEDISAQSAMELPDRETMLIVVVVNNVLNNLTVEIPVKNNNIAVQVCAAVELINVELLTIDSLECDIEQKQ